MTLGDWLKLAEGRLGSRPDAIWIAEETLNLPRSRMGISRGVALTSEQLASLETNAQRRERGEPVQYIFNRAPFMGFEFYVDKRVLIPRMDTETLACAALDFIRDIDAARVLDLCAGSGAIGISIKRLRPDARVTLSDISAQAAEVQRANSRDIDIEILTGDMFSTVPGRKFDAIVCNPPYISKREMPCLSAEVQREPALALDGGEDGLDFYRYLAKRAREHIAPGGRLLMEAGYSQAREVMDMFDFSFSVRDICGVERVVCADIS